MKMDDSNRPLIPVVSSGNIALDIVLGTGGYPMGRIIEIFGPESSGKTTLALHGIAEIQKIGGIAAFIDAEHAIDINYAKKLGVQVEDLLLSQPDYGEQALEIAEVLIRSGAVNVIVIDSVAALVPKAEIEGDMGDSHMGLQARLMSQALRKITALCSKSDCIVVFINQLRQKIGIVFGNPEVTTGGNALKFYSSVRLDIRRITSIKQGDQLVGNRVRIKVVKNKMAPPFGTTEVDIMFNQGISHHGAIVDLGLQAGIIVKSGSWFAYQDKKIGQGRENAKQSLKEDPTLAIEIENSIYDFYQLPHLKKKLASKTTAEKNTSASSSSPDVADSENPKTDAKAKAKEEEEVEVEAVEAGKVDTQNPAEAEAKAKEVVSVKRFIILADSSTSLKKILTPIEKLEA